jgi:ring-1,2-phenylacetyl-CoA epoxidase subunit PaaD
VVTAALAAPQAPAADGCSEAAWQVLQGVLDPEVPALSVCDLGLVRALHPQAAGGLEVVLTPTYSGCPATEVIGAAVAEALDAAGFGPVQITWRRSPAWSTDWISEAGRAKLLAYGIAPPGPVEPAEAGAAPRAQPLRLVDRRVACPRCQHPHTERLSAFGSTACKALYRCLSCREPFEHFKPL